MHSESGGSQREGLIPASRPVETNIDATGIPQCGQEWMAREKGP
jgi:hypothetical protein